MTSDFRPRIWDGRGGGEVGDGEGKEEGGEEVMILDCDTWLGSMIGPTDWLIGWSLHRSVGWSRTGQFWGGLSRFPASDGYLKFGTRAIYA